MPLLRSLSPRDTPAPAPTPTTAAAVAPSRSPSAAVGRARGAMDASSRAPTRTTRRRAAPTPALNDERIKQENIAMRQRLRDAKPRARALANADTTANATAVGTGNRRANAPASPPALARVNARTAVNAAADMNMPARTVRRRATPTPAAANDPRDNQENIRPRSRLAPTNGNINVPAPVNENSPTRVTRLHVNERANQQNANVSSRIQRARPQALARTNVNANANTVPNGSVAVRVNATQARNGPRHAPSAAASSRPSATRARTSVRAPPARAQAHAHASSAALAPVPTPSPIRAPRPRRHVTPALHDPNIQQANLELRRRIREAKATAKTRAGCHGSRPPTQAIPTQPPSTPLANSPRTSDASSATTAPMTDSDARSESHSSSNATSTNSRLVPLEDSGIAPGDAMPRLDTLAPAVDATLDRDESDESDIESETERLAIAPEDVDVREPLPSAARSVAAPLTLGDIDISDEPFATGGFGAVHLANVKTSITSFRSIWGHEESVNSDPTDPDMMAIKVMKLKNESNGKNENKSDEDSEDGSDSSSGGNDELNAALAERDALLAIPPHPMVIKLHAAIEDKPKNKLYLLTELGWRGDLRYLQDRQPGGIFKECDARFYAASIALALQHIHAFDYVHRDIKPDNIVIGEDKRPKVIDFGFAKKLGPGERSTDRCGTLLYCAPEILLAKETEEARERSRRQHDDSKADSEVVVHVGVDADNYCQGFNRAVDWWAYGAMVYEMIVGCTPFRSHHCDLALARCVTENNLKRYGKGLINLPFPAHVSPEARNFIRRLLARDPERRLGMKNDDELRNHPWFKDINWAALLAAKVPVLMD